LRSTAAWRISIWTTLAFALGTAAAFSIVYLLVAQGLRERSDTWLSGEAEVLAQVSADTPSAPHATKVDARWRASPGNMNNLSFVRHDEFIL
jgi:hypothetical protein